MESKDVEILIIGSGVAGVTVARSLLNKGATDILMLEAGGHVPMGDDRRWQDFTMKGLGEGNRAYSHCVDERGRNASFVNVGGGHKSGYPKFPKHEWDLVGSRLITRGGTMLHWGGWAFRLKPEDFKLKTNTGIGMDWQFGYDDMESYYSEAECLFQVMGKENDVNQPPRPTGQYPYQSIPYAATDGALIDFFDRKGITYGPVPLSRNTIRNNNCHLGLKDDPISVGSATPCMATGTCKYCPFKAKFSNDQSIDHVQKQHHDQFELITMAPVKKLIMKGKKAIGAIYVDKDTNTEKRVNAKFIIIASGALESPKLLIASGIENHNIGMHLTSHPLFVVRGTKKHDQIAPQQELHFPTLCSRHFDSERYQKQGKLLLAKYYTKPYTDIGKLISQGYSTSKIDDFLKTEEYEIRGFIENVKGTNTKVSPAKGLDRWGLPRTKLEISGDIYPEKAIKHYLDQISGWIKEMGYDFKKYKVYSPRGDHAMSTCRMANNSNEGVVDKTLKVYGTDNVFVVSNAVYPNGGVVNPTLTLAAVALKFSKEFSDNYL